MLGTTRLFALCASAALALSAGCTPDSPTVAGPDAQLDQEALGTAGHPRSPPQHGSDADIGDRRLCGTRRM